MRDIHPAFMAAPNPDRAPSSAPTVRPDSRSAGQAGAEARLVSAPANFLALDQSLTLIGWALGARGVEVPVTGTFGLPTICGPNGEAEIGAVLHQARAFLEERSEQSEISHIVYEAVHFDEDKKNALTYAQLYTIAAHIRLFSIDADVTAIAVAPQEWRQQFLGFRDSRALKGTKTTLKQAAIKRCEALGWPVKNHHEAEACGMLSWVLASRFADEAVRMDSSPLFRRGAR